MSYHRFTFQGEKKYFVKRHDPKLFTDKVRRKDAKLYIKKEAKTYKHLKKHRYPHIPVYTEHRSNLLILSELPVSGGWLWRLPEDESRHAQYISDILSCFNELENLPLPKKDYFYIPALTVFYDEGWGSMSDKQMQSIIRINSLKWSNKLHSVTKLQARKMINDIQSLRIDANIKTRGEIYNHHDARQSNIAWHPKKGVAIVDWSWAGKGLKNGDQTMFLMDLVKSEIKLTPEQLSMVNKEYACLVLGWLLCRSAEPHSEGNEIVRLHQFASAVSAYKLIRLAAKRVCVRQ